MRLRTFCRLRVPGMLGTLSWICRTGAGGLHRTGVGPRIRTDSHTLGVDGAQVAVLQQVYHKILRRLHHGRAQLNLWREAGKIPQVGRCSGVTATTSSFKSQRGIDVAHIAHLLRGEQGFRCPPERLRGDLVRDFSHLRTPNR